MLKYKPGDRVKHATNAGPDGTVISADANLEKPYDVTFEIEGELKIVSLTEDEIAFSTRASG